MQPVVQLLVAAQLDEFALDQQPLTFVHMAIGLGGRDQRLEDCLAVLFSLGCRQAVDGLRLAAGRIGLLRLPIAVGLVSQ